MGFPNTHQELLAAYIAALQTNIGEFSSDVEGHTRQVHEWAKQYAAANGLECPVEEEN